MTARERLAQHTAELWHWVAAVIAVLILVAWHSGQDLRGFIIALLVWEAVGVQGHYMLRRLRG